MNLGFIARICMNFDADELFLVRPRANIQEAIPYAVHAADYLRNAVIVDRLRDALRGVELSVATSGKGAGKGDYLRQAVPARYFAEHIYPAYRSVALVFGRESTGLTREEIEMTDMLVTIPASPRYPILNLSHAVAILLYEIRLARGLPANNLPEPADRDEIKALTGIVEETMRLLGIHEDKRTRLRRIVETMLYRARPSAYEARGLRYLAYKILGRLRECGT